MCGIVGYIDFEKENSWKESLKDSLLKLSQRGPDHAAIFHNKGVGLGHTRLSILDTSPNAHQPMTDPSGRYTLVYNGEIYNYMDLKKSVQNVHWRSTGDTEVLLHLLIQQGVSCLGKLNGFFALAFYDSHEDSLVLARDRFGIKPLVYAHEAKKLIFASELKAILSFPISKEINPTSLFWYLRLNYLPGNLSMLQGITRLEPGNYLSIQGREIKKQSFVEQLNHKAAGGLTYDQAKSELLARFEESVQKRLISDVPLGAFLSGGTDSSATVAMASRHHKNLHTFSIGYQDHSYFDETHYANLVAKKFQTNHTVFSLTNDDLLDDIESILNYIDEPFADSSAIPTFILSKQVSKYIKVALSGDGADELFSGYYKHQALYSASTNTWMNAVIQSISPVLKSLPKSRSGSISNTVRRLERYARLLELNSFERYWFLASMTYNPSKFVKYIRKNLRRKE